MWDCTDTIAANADCRLREDSQPSNRCGQVDQIKRPTTNYGMSRISPDGRAVAFLELLDSDTVVLLTVPTAGGAARS